MTYKFDGFRGRARSAAALHYAIERKIYTVNPLKTVAGRLRVRLRWWIPGESGTPAIDVAERAGHSAAMLLSTYAHCIEGQEERPADASKPLWNPPRTKVAVHAVQPRPTGIGTGGLYRACTAATGRRRVAVGHNRTCLSPPLTELTQLRPYPATVMG